MGDQLQTPQKPSPEPSISHGRGGAGNINPDATKYVDGEVTRTGVEGTHGDGAYSTGRGGMLYAPFFFFVSLLDLSLYKCFVMFIPHFLFYFFWNYVGKHKKCSFFFFHFFFSRWTHAAGDLFI